MYFKIPTEMECLMDKCIKKKKKDWQDPGLNIRCAPGIVMIWFGIKTVTLIISIKQEDSFL